MIQSSTNLGNFMVYEAANINPDLAAEGFKSKPFDEKAAVLTETLGHLGLVKNQIAIAGSFALQVYGIQDIHARDLDLLLIDSEYSLGDIHKRTSSANDYEHWLRLYRHDGVQIEIFQHWAPHGLATLFQHEVRTNLMIVNNWNVLAIPRIIEYKLFRRGESDMKHLEILHQTRNLWKSYYEESLELPGNYHKYTTIMANFNRLFVEH